MKYQLTGRVQSVKLIHLEPDYFGKIDQQITV